MVEVPGRHFEIETSTMDVAKREFMHENWGWVSATQQTLGRGTQGRPWLSPSGNLYMTLAIRLSCFPKERLATLSLEVGLALYECLKGLAEEADIRPLWLKWPNDLLWNDQKVAGFLLEVYQTHVLIGLGLNLTTSPEIADGGRNAGDWIGLSQIPLERLTVGQAFANHMVSKVLGPWNEMEKASLLEQWSKLTRWNQRLAIRSGNRHRIQSGNHEAMGAQAIPLVQPIELTTEGHLKVKHESGKIEVLVADYLW